jgi:hypothetical protein
MNDSKPGIVRLGLLDSGSKELGMDVTNVNPVVHRKGK